MKDKDLVEKIVMYSRDLYHETVAGNKLVVKNAATRLLDFVSQQTFSPTLEQYKMSVKNAYEKAQTLSLDRDTAHKLYQMALYLQNK